MSVLENEDEIEELGSELVDVAKVELLLLSHAPQQSAWRAVRKWRRNRKWHYFVISLIRYCDCNMIHYKWAWSQFSCSEKTMYLLGSVNKLNTFTLLCYIYLHLEHYRASFTMLLNVQKLLPHPGIHCIDADHLYTLSWTDGGIWWVYTGAVEPAGRKQKKVLVMHPIASLPHVLPSVLVPVVSSAVLWSMQGAGPLDQARLWDSEG